MLIKVSSNRFTKQFYSIVLSATALFPVYSYADSQTETADVTKLDHYVITGTRTSKLLLDSPVKIEVVTREDIKFANAKNLKEAIEDVPGIAIREIHGKSGYEAWMQGLDGKRVLVLIDSEPVSQSTNRITDLTQIGVMNIEQIEIVKGATSALYGSGAIGGVINVITSVPQSPLSYTLKGDIGSYADQNIKGEEFDVATQSAAGNLTFLKGNWDGQLSFDLRDTDGFTAHRDEWEEEGPSGSKFNAAANLGYSPVSGHRYYLGSSYYKEDLANKYNSTGPTPKPWLKNEDAERFSYKTGAEWQTESSGDFSLRFTHETFEDITTQDIYTSAELDKYRNAEHTQQKLSSQWNLDLNAYSTWTFGAEWDKEDIDQYQWTRQDDGSIEYSEEIIGDASAQRRVFYAQNDLFINERLELLPGFRYQHDSDFGTYFSPKINGRYLLSEAGGFDQHLRFGLGRGYRVPTLKERYYEFDHSQHGYMVLGNADLTPEYSDSFQLGWVISGNDKITVDINLFRNHLKDFIETQLSSISNDGIETYEYGNIESARTQGVELVTQYKPTKYLKTTLGYTHQEAKDRKTNLWLPKRARHQVKTSIQWQPFQNNLTTLLLSAQWESASFFDAENLEKSPEHSVFDFKLTQKLSHEISVYGGIDNFTDTQKDFDFPHDLRPAAGRYFYIGLRLDTP